MDGDREGGGMDGSGKLSVGSVLRGRLGSRNQLLVESLCKWREIYLLSIDYLIKTVEFLYEIGMQEVAHWFKMTIPGSKWWLAQDGRIEKALWSRINPWLNLRVFFMNSLCVLRQNVLEFTGPDSLSVKWGYKIYYLFFGPPWGLNHHHLSALVCTRICVKNFISIFFFNP